MALPKEPRQKMINMMYLVLTALLALNVSSEILNAFKTVDSSLTTASGIIEKKNEDLFKSFQAKLAKAETKAKAEEWYPKAQEAQKLADETIKYIDDLKLELKQEAGLQVKDGVEEYREDNLDAATRLFVEKKPNGKEKGPELFKKLSDFKDKLMAIHPKIKENLEARLPLDLSTPKLRNSKEVNGKDNWEYAYFHMTPTIAAITMLSKFQNDVRNCEAQVVEFCHKEIGEVEVQYDAFQAIASQSSEYLMPGQELRITGGVGAFSSAAKPTVTVDGATVALNAQGVAEYKTTVGGPGAYVKKVSISFKKPDGTTATLTQDVKYTVGSPTGVTVSADAVKVLYIGLDNPVSITGGAKGAEAIQAKIDNGEMVNQGGGRYIVRPENAGKATITVSVDGKVSTADFKVKNVPLPTPMVGTSTGGRMSANTFKANVGLRAELKDFVFEGVKYTVTNFLIIGTGKGFEATGPKYTQNQGAYFSADAKNIIEMCKPGSSVIFTDIVVDGPGGSRKLDGQLVFNLSQ
ncbi:MAG: gliding motility protein GldM [Sphingobacteriia bacterium]|nr:gliding motility protein GldM [Sphingobacteriia bacterium]